MSTVFVSYWWGDGETICENSGYDYVRKKKTRKMTYNEIAEHMKSRLTKLKLPHHIEYITFPNHFSHQDKINYKAVFIQKMIRQFRCPVVYVDIDMRIHGNPILFTHTQGHYDFMAFNWNSEPHVSSIFDWFTLETSGGLLYFNNTKASKRLLRLWSDELKLNRNKADDRVLAMVFAKTNAYKWLKFYWVPAEYFYIPQYFKSLPLKQVVISHPMSMSNERRILNELKTDSRVPKHYDEVVTSKIKHNPNFIESCVPYKAVKMATRYRNKRFQMMTNAVDRTIIKTNCVHKNKHKLTNNDIYYWSSFVHKSS